MRWLEHSMVSERVALQPAGMNTVKIGTKRVKFIWVVAYVLQKHAHSAIEQEEKAILVLC